jgi:tRNA 2-thiouridine synthesizing protein E
MQIIEYAGLSVELDDDGYLFNYDEWNEKVACALAEIEGVDELTDERMEIIKFMRSYYQTYHHFPVLSGICRNVHQEKDCVKHQFIDPLSAWKIAGLPKPSPQVIGYLHGQGGVV